MRHADRAEPHIGMAEHDALGLAGRSAGIEDRSERVGIMRGWRQCTVPLFSSRKGLAFLQNTTTCGDVACFERGKAGLRPQQQHRSAVGEDMRDLRALEQRIDRHMHQSRTSSSQRQQAGQLAFCRPTRHARTGPCLLRQPGRQQRDTISQGLVGKHRVAQNQRRRLCTSALGQLIERMRRGIRHHCS